MVYNERLRPNTVLGSLGKGAPAAQLFRGKHVCLEGMGGKLLRRRRNFSETAKDRVGPEALIIRH